MFAWIKKFNLEFITSCRFWYKKWSSYLALVWGLIGVFFWNLPDWLPDLVSSLPPEVRALLSPVVLAVLAGLPIIVANLRQHKLETQIKQLVEKANAGQQ